MNKTGRSGLMHFHFYRLHAFTPDRNALTGHKSPEICTSSERGCGATWKFIYNVRIPVTKMVSHLFANFRHIFQHSCEQQRGPNTYFPHWFSLSGYTRIPIVCLSTIPVRMGHLFRFRWRVIFFIGSFRRIFCNAYQTGRVWKAILYWSKNRVMCYTRRGLPPRVTL